jgi:Protein of unknown function (DUF2815).
MASEKFNIENGRIAFANDIWTAKSVNGSKPAFAASFLIPPTHPAVAKLRALFVKLANEQWGAKGAAQLKALEATDKLCLHNGDTKTYAGYAGNLYVSARNQTKPRVVDRNANDITQESGIVYSGCRVIALLEIWTQDNQFGKRINATLRGVQFFSDDERFSGGGAATDDEFQKLDATEEEDVMA